MRTTGESRMPDGARRLELSARQPTEDARLHRDTEAQPERTALDEIFSRANHELRTPLTSIQALTEIMLDSSELSPETTRNFLSIILEDSRRLGRAVDEFLVIHLPEIGSVALGHGCERTTRLPE